uniref:Uncharacterized protein n=1 Tax=Anguilla anguilla TaxID=7936 RepID=A0A0E9SUQ3_ANGAN
MVCKTFEWFSFCDCALFRYLGVHHQL